MSSEQTQGTIWQDAITDAISAAIEATSAMQLALSELARQTLAVEARLEALEQRVTAIEAQLAPPPPAPEPEPEPEPPVIVVKDEEPVLITDSGEVTIDLKGNTWPGIRTPRGEAGYRIKTLTIRGPGTIKPRPGVPALDIANLADRGQVFVIGTEDEGLRIEASGDDVAAISAPSICCLSLRDCLIVAAQKATADRHARPAAVWAPQTYVTALDCVIVGGNSSIYSSDLSSAYVRLICLPRQFAVNGYCLTGGYAGKCLLLPQGSGRGWLCERGFGALRDSVVLGLDRGALSNASPSEPAAMYDPWGLDGCAVRVRTIDPQQPGRAEIVGNKILAIGGGPFCHAAAVMLSHGSAVLGLPLTVVEANEMCAFNVGAGDDRFSASPLVLVSQGSRNSMCADVIANNELRGNQHLLSTTGHDNAQGCHQGPMLDNRFAWETARRGIAAWKVAAQAHYGRIYRPWHAAHDVRRLVEDALAQLDGLGTPGATSVRRDAKSWRQGFYGPHELAFLKDPRELTDTMAPVAWGPDDKTPSALAGERRLTIERGNVITTIEG